MTEIANEIVVPNEVEQASAQRDTDSSIHRILRTMIVVGCVATPMIWYVWGRKFALGFAAGSVLSVINFRWLRFTTVGITNAAARYGQRTSTFGMLYRVVLRYALIGIVAYAMINSSFASVYGLLPGLFLPSLALMVEAAFQSVRTLRGKS
jgi:hypothetical protein